MSHAPSLRTLVCCNEGMHALWLGLGVSPQTYETIHRGGWTTGDGTGVRSSGHWAKPTGPSLETPIFISNSLLHTAAFCISGIGTQFYWPVFGPSSGAGACGSAGTTNCWAGVAGPR